MNKRAYWRAMAARDLRRYRRDRKSWLKHRQPHRWETAGMWLRLYREARAYADYWEHYGEGARAPSWYHPD